MTLLRRLLLIVWVLWCVPSWAVNRPYDGAVSSNVKRDRILAIAEDYVTLYYYQSAANIDYSGYTGATCPDPTVGWKTGMKYCWGGEDTTKQYLLRMAEGDGAGNRNTSSSSSYDTYCGGADCSGFASNTWTSPRVATSGFPNISIDLLWEQLRQGDALNNAGSHIRVFDYFISQVGTAMLYESTSGGGAWKCIHRSLARDNTYQPIRYQYTYRVVVYPQPDITYIKRTGIERVEVRWDGEASTGFNLYLSTNGTAWTLIRDSASLTLFDRVCEVSGLLPDTTYYFKMTSQNTAGESPDSDVVAYRLDGDSSHRVILVDGNDRYNDQNSGASHTLLTRFGEAMGQSGVGFDFCSNEAIVDNQIDLRDYQVAVWMFGEESTFDETFSWAEQYHTQRFLDAGGCLFVSGAEIGWDLDYRADSTTHKNGSPNDRPFYNNYLLASFVADDANTYQVQAMAGTIYAGLSFSFDNGSQGTYNVAYPDVIAPTSGATSGMHYQGGTGGIAAVYGSSGTGSVVNMGFPFETIYPNTARASVMSRTLNYFDVPALAPTLQSAIQTASDAVTLNWDGHANIGFRLFQRIGGGSWVQIRDTAALASDARTVTVTGLSVATQYAFKMTAVNASGSSTDSDVLVCSLGSVGNSVLVVDGYDRWNAQSGGVNHIFLERYADALSANGARYDSCSNEAVTSGSVSLADYAIVIWMCGEESTESETFGYDEQMIVQNYLKQGGGLFVSGSEIGWDLIDRGGALNNFSNGSDNDTAFHLNYLKAGFVSDDANSYSVVGASGTVFNGLSFSFDDGTQGTYDVKYPDVLSANGGSTNALYYSPGSNVAGVLFSGTFPGGTFPGKLIYFGFPFETIYNATTRANVMSAALTYLTPTPVNLWQMY